MAQSGPKNTITDVEGLLVGHYTDSAAASGVTVILCPDGAVGGVDVRGAAPGTRETDLLNPVNLVERVQAIVLAGGSVYGLAAVPRAWLTGWPNGATASPWATSPARSPPLFRRRPCFDLGRGENFVPPTGPAWGRAACEAATTDFGPLGNFGAGTGAFSGPIKGGLGAASLAMDCGIVVGAATAVNSLGSIINPRTGLAWEADLELGDEFGPLAGRAVTLPEPRAAEPGSNTTIGVVAVGAALTKAEATKVAQMAHDGLGRAIRPAHTMYDGDTIFCLSVGETALDEREGFFTGVRGGGDKRNRPGGGRLLQSGGHSGSGRGRRRPRPTGLGRFGKEVGLTGDKTEGKNLDPGGSFLVYWSDHHPCSSVSRNKRGRFD